MNISKRNKQLILLWVLPLLAVAISLVTNANYPASLILFWGIPSIILTFWAKSKALKASLFAIAGTILLMGMDIIFYATGQWAVVSAFSYRFLGMVAWEDVLYFFLWIYFPVMFWEHFFEKQVREPVWATRMTRLVSASVIVFSLIVAAWIWTPLLIQIPYFYLLSMIIFLAIPLTLELLAHPRLGMRFVRVGLYFGYVGFLYEITALFLRHWYYPSDQFIGWVEIINLRFPIEELFAWMILGAAAILSWYEYFDDKISNLGDARHSA